ncbi:MAG: hypothetical protein HYY41_03400 [Chloroflexi bacterium]|nr:hypothetical protein [Chloroflexota bacterium]
MPLADKIDADWQRREILCAWIAWQMEIGDSPKAVETMRRVVNRKADLHLNELLKTREIPSSDPVTVCRHIADYLTASGYAEYQIGKISDTILYRDWKNCVEMPLIPWAMKEMGLKVTPNPSTSLFHAAIRKLCNMKAEIIWGDDIPKNAVALTPEEFKQDWRQEWEEDRWGREFWRLSPLK